MGISTEPSTRRLATASQAGIAMLHRCRARECGLQSSLPESRERVLATAVVAVSATKLPFRGTLRSTGVNCLEACSLPCGRWRLPPPDLIHAVPLLSFSCGPLRARHSWQEEERPVYLWTPPPCSLPPADDANRDGLFLLARGIRSASIDGPLPRTRTAKRRARG